eukprot:symbB.v1.2.019560.t1/scaffold1600.1/size109688/3
MSFPNCPQQSLTFTSEACEAKQKIDPVEGTKTRRWRVRLKRGGMPQLSCSLGAAPGHKYRQPDFQELAEQYPLIHKALEVARHGKQKHWDLDAEEDSRPPLG